MNVSLESYSQFYDKVANDRSIQPITDEVRAYFSKPDLATLAIKVKSETGQASSKNFLELQLIPNGDYYRVHLRASEGSTEGWAYFYHPSIYRDSLKLFVKQP